jgi:hypothetical protein
MKDIPVRRERRQAARRTKTVFQRINGARTPFKAAVAFFEELNRIRQIAEHGERTLALREFLVKYGDRPRSRGHGVNRAGFKRTVFSQKLQDRSAYDPATEDRKHAKGH